jgi:hypothetical protein
VKNMNERTCKNCGTPISFCEQCECWHHEISNWQCPKCHSLEFNYVEYKNGQKLIVSPCGWELCYIEGPKDDMDIEETDYSED